MDEIAYQRSYYRESSGDYNAAHAGSNAHYIAGMFLLNIIKTYFKNKSSILDIGAGTGRFQHLCQTLKMSTEVIGIEPVEALRQVGYTNGIPKERLIHGDATDLGFPDNSFDFVTEFGVLHHIRDSRKVTKEMVRVANKGVFISDSNRYGQGSKKTRIVKAILKHLHLYWLGVFIRTRGKGYIISEGDGLSYSFSLFDIMDVVTAKFPYIYLVATEPTKSTNLEFGCDCGALLALKDPLDAQALVDSLSI